MARIFQTGFETGNGELFNISQATNLRQDHVRGSWSNYSCLPNGAPALTFPGGNLSEFYTGFGWYSGGQGLLVRVSDQTFAALGDHSTWVAMHNNTKIAVYNSTSIFGDAANIVAESGDCLLNGVWQYVEIYLKCGDANGAVIVHVDGVEVLNASGIDTNQNTTSANWDRIEVGSDNNARIDDWYINDTTGSINNGFSGDTRIQGFFPASAGDVTGLSRGGANSGSNWGQVDETTPNDATDYVYGTDTSSYDLYNIADLSTAAVIQAVIIWARAEKSDAGSGNVSLGVKYDSDGDTVADTEDWGSDQTLSTSWSYQKRMLDKMPNGAAWTRARLNALQIGVKSR